MAADLKEKLSIEDKYLSAKILGWAERVGDGNTELRDYFIADMILLTKHYTFTMRAAILKKSIITLCGFAADFLVGTNYIAFGSLCLTTIADIYRAT